MTAAYIQPGMPAPQPPTPQPNTYIMPTTALQQSMPSSPQAPPEPPQTHHRDDPHRVLLSEWRSCHGCEWTRADDLAPTVRQMIDAKDRVAAIRQRLRQLVATHRELETKIAGNRARRVVLYRVTGIEIA